MSACEKEYEAVPQLTAKYNAASTATVFEEGFETAYKSSYTADQVAFSNGSWLFDDALTGNTSSDRKTGTQSARVRNSGKISMSFDLPDGAKSFTMSHGKFGSDKNSTLEVFYSTNSGSTWISAGPSVTVSSKSLTSTTYALNITGPVRFEVRKTDGTSNRANIDDIQVEPNPAVLLPDFMEDFESGSKGSYTAGSVNLSTGTWLLNEALIGSLESDRKTGTKSVRIRDLGTLEMQFNVQGAQSVNISHAVYGTDAGSTWQLQASTNDGASWLAVGSNVNSASTTLQDVSFSVNYTSAVRFRIVKLSGSGTRINIDNFTISGSSSGTGEPGGGTPGGGTDTTTVVSVHLTLGNPSNAATDVNLPNNYLLMKAQYVMSYSRDKGTANWVSWHLDEAWLGSTPRQDDFRADNTLPSGWYQVGATDYSYSGFDRGHITPSADRTLTVEDNSSTFLMTNMIPQAPNNNRTTWASLESYCRSMLTGGYEIYIISGGYGVGGTGSNGYATTIANGNVTVPSNTWKVILILPDGNNDAARVTSSTRVIAVDMPNDQTILSDWRAYRTTVDAIEAKTGYDFFSLVPDSIENVIEAKIDTL
ncbi:hypothetical protein GCM10027293_07980 [Pontibacter aydingkolensis]